MGLFAFIGYLAIPVGTVVGGYVKNWLLSRWCRRCGLIKILPGTWRALGGFSVLALALAVVLRLVPIESVWTLGAAIAVFGIIDLPLAWSINKKC
jgi:hypothetical protein